jgi:hypothetical protein
VLLARRNDDGLLGRRDFVHVREYWDRCVCHGIFACVRVFYGREII